MQDLISRQAAVELIHSMYPSAPIMRMNRERWEKKYKPYIEAEKALERLPSAQPEIIHCKECIYGVQDEYERWYCRGFGCQVGEEDGSGFCADAERRTDAED